MTPETWGAFSQGGRRVVALVAAGLLGGALPAMGQSVRGSVGSTVQMVELRPIAPLDTGCVPDVPCYLALDEVRSVAATQDVFLTGWGFGVQGLSATVALRGRARAGSDFLWPRTDDRFDALLAYGQLVRESFTVRLGRQEVRSGLGFPSFDGGSVTWHGRTRSLRLEGYAGRSLARGLREPTREALRGVESFVPDQAVLLFGGSARTRLRGLSVTARYQRELLDDRSGLASERGSMDLSLVTPRGRFLGSLDYDFAMGQAGKGELGWSAPFGEGRWIVEATALRYVPYFSLSTIWGFFEPVAYHGVQGRVGWSPSGRVAAWLVGGWRKYGDAEAPVVLEPLDDVGRRAEIGARWVAGAGLTLDAEYQLEWGPGGFLSSLDGSAQWAASERLSLVGSVMTFQQIEQYRLGDGRGLGAGLSADAQLTERIRLSGGISLLSHTGGDEDSSATSPWNQSRAWSSVRVVVGEDPGLANRRRR